MAGEWTESEGRNSGTPEPHGYQGFLLDRIQEPMKTSRHVALLRGINVGKAKRIVMVDLRALLETLGYGEVRTLLNSGNAVFEAPVKSRGDHAEKIQTAIAKELGVESFVVVKSAAEIEAIAAELEGSGIGARATDLSRLLAVFTRDAKSLAPLAALADEAAEGEELVVGKGAAFLWCANGILESRLATILLRTLGGSGTTRNWATVEKIRVLLQPADKSGNRS